MKKIILTAVIKFALLLTCIQMNAQVTVPSNAGGAGDYVGWDAGQAFPLNIRQNNTTNPQPINFWTDGIQRMTILGNNTLTNGYVGIHTTAPLMPLHVHGDANNPVTSAGWAAGIYLDNHAVITFASDGNPNCLLMGHPSTNPTGEFYCTLAPNITTASPTNDVYRIIGNPIPGAPNFTPPNTGDFEFLSPAATPHNVLADGNLGIGLNIGVTPLYTPTNRLEINTTASATNFVAPNVLAASGNSGQFVPTGNGGTGFSGLRFTDLRSTSTAELDNPGSGVLSVDRNGDVIYVPDNVFGAVCGSPTPFDLTDDWRIGLGGQTLYFEGQGGDFANNVAIGYNCYDDLLGKLNVVQRVPTVINNHTISSAGIFHSAPDTPCNFSVGVLGRSTGHTTLGIGVAGIADGVGAVGNQWAFGIYGETTPIGENSLTNRNWAGVFNGPVISNVGFLTSDSLLKKDIRPITHGLNIIDSLKPVSFLFDTATANAAGLYLPVNKQYGFLAQEVEKILPDLVIEALKPPQYDTLGNEIHPAFTFKALNYNAFTGILMQGIKELDSITKNLALQIDTINNTKDSLDYDFLLSGSNNHPVLPADIGKSKYTTGHLGINYNSANPDCVFHVENNDDIPHFDNNPTALFHADARGFKLPGYFINVSSIVENIPNAPTLVFGVVSEIHSQYLNNDNIAVLGFCDGEGQNNFGTKGYAQGAITNYGLHGETLTNLNIGYGMYGLSVSQDINTNAINYGVFGDALNGQLNYGGYFTARTDPGSVNAINYGVYSSAIGDSAIAGYFNGDVFCTGQYLGSDILLKENVAPLTDALSIIGHLNSKTYNFKVAAFPQLNLPSGNQFGLIAQEVESVLPTLTRNLIQPPVYDTLGNMVYPSVSFKGLNYEAFIKILIEGVKELNLKTDSLTNDLNNEIDSLKHVINSFNDRFNQMEAMLNNCCLSNNKSLSNPEENPMTITEVELVNQQAIVLDQNVPNPFKENTVIAYFIPDNINYTQIIFTDNYGKIMKTVDITTPGQGILKVYAANLSSGIYQYSLIVDGKVIETKKMVCTK